MFVPLQECGKEEVLDVGVRAQNMGQVATQINVPFTLVLTSALFDGFLSHNGITDLIDQAAGATTTDMQIRLFSQVQEQILKGRFNDQQQHHIKECFELVCLDTENLGQKKHCILSIQRSTDYEDKDYTTPSFAFSTDNLKTFTNAIKQVMLSLFTPASIADRLQNGIKVFTSGFMVSRLPSFGQVLEVDYEYKKHLRVKSYIGFIDPGRVVERDEFTVAEEFLRIQNNMIVNQNAVSIFDLDTSRVVYKEFKQGSGQSVPNQLVLEAGRLAKRIREATHSAGMQSIFLGDGKELFCLSARAQQQSKAHNKIMARQKLAKELITFLQSHSYPEFEGQIKSIANNLNQSQNLEDLKDALQLSLNIMQFEK